MNTQWTYNTAFKRNRGLINELEQDLLKNSLVVIPGCGGIGSTIAETLARMGVGGFRLCDPDNYDVSNFNRQLAATTDALGRNKAQATRDRILSINPDANVEVWLHPVAPHNADEFVQGASLVLDGIDFFKLNARRALFAAAKRANIVAMTAAPLGFSATLQVFHPSRGMSFDEYFNFHEEDDVAIVLTKFWLGLSPKGLHRGYMDLSEVDIAAQAGPSSVIGTQLAASLVGGEAIRTLLNRDCSLTAPWYVQFDSYTMQWVKRRLHGGNKHPLQRFKLLIAKQSFAKSGLWDKLQTIQIV